MASGPIFRRLYMCSLLVAGHAAVAKSYTYAVISPPGTTQTTPVALSSTGVVLGIWVDSADAPHGFTFQNGTYTNIDYPKAIYTQPSGFNANGDIVGSYVDKTHQVFAFLLSKGKFKTVTAPGSNNTDLVGINDSNVALGYSSAGTGSAFTYAAGKFTTINSQQYVSPVAINKTGSAIGDYFPPQPQPITCWFYSGGVLMTIPVSSSIAEVSGLNDKNEVVGMQAVGSVFEGFLFKNNKLSTINVPKSTGTYPEGISNTGAITGYYTDANGNEIGFVQSKGKFTSLNAPNAAGTFGQAINTAGQVLGGYHDANRVQYVFLATPAK